MWQNMNGEKVMTCLDLPVGNTHIERPIMNQILFTNDVPTKPGYYLWRIDDEDDELTLCEVVERVGGVLYVFEVGVNPKEKPNTPAEEGGQWCRLAPSDFIRQAYIEAYWKCMQDVSGSDTLKAKAFEYDFANSDSKKMMDWPIAK